MEILGTEKGQISPKMILQVFVFLVIIIILFLVYKKIKAKFGKSQTDLEVEKEVRIQFSKLPKSDPKALSYKNKDTYKNFALKLYKALSNSWRGFGLDNEALRIIFAQMHSYADLIELKRAFGIKDGKDLDLYISEKVPADWTMTANPFSGITIKEINEILKKQYKGKKAPYQFILN